MIESLFGSAIKAKIVQWLYVQAKPAQKISEASLARAIGVRPGSIFKPLQQLVAAQFVVRDQELLGSVYRAPHEDPRMKGLFVFLRQESQIVEQLRRALRKLPHVTYACIFGSFARGATHKESDIDLLVIESTKDAKGAERNPLAIYGLTSKLSDKLEREVSPQIYSEEEFAKLVAENNPLAISIIADRIDLKGTPPWLT